MNIIIKDADKGSTVAWLGHIGFHKEKEKQLGDSKIYEEVHDDSGPLITTIHKRK